MALPFFGALLLAMQLGRGPSRAAADAAHPGFMMRDETAAAGIHFVHRRPSFDPKIAGIEPHVAALGASVSVTDFDGDGWPDGAEVDAGTDPKNPLSFPQGAYAGPAELTVGLSAVDIANPGAGIISATPAEVYVVNPGVVAGTVQAAAAIAGPSEIFIFRPGSKSVATDEPVALTLAYPPVTVQIGP